MTLSSTLSLNSRSGHNLLARFSRHSSVLTGARREALFKSRCLGMIWAGFCPVVNGLRIFYATKCSSLGNAVRLNARGQIQASLHGFQKYWPSYLTFFHLKDTTVLAVTGRLHRWLDRAVLFLFHLSISELFISYVWAQLSLPSENWIWPWTRMWWTPEPSQPRLKSLPIPESKPQYPDL